jgi:hypothetical protein
MFQLPPVDQAGGRVVRRGRRFDPARLHSMRNESDRITSHLLFQRPKSEPSALNPTRARSSSLRHLRHCVIPIEANPPAAVRRAHHHQDCVICVIASYRSKPTRQPPSDARTIIRTASSASSASLRHTDRSQPASSDPTCAPSKIAFGALLEFLLNHRYLERSDRPERMGKNPAELLTGQSHAHWLEMLG